MTRFAVVDQGSRKLTLLNSHAGALAAILFVLLLGLSISQAHGSVTPTSAAPQATGAQGALVQATPRITQAIDDAFVVRIPNTTHPLATPGNDRGRVDASLPMNRILLLLKPSDAQQAALRKLIDSQHDPESAGYQGWLTPEQYAVQFGPAQGDLNRITLWLKQHNFAVGSAARGGQWIEFSGTAAQVEAAFHTEIHNYMVRGEAHVANATDIYLPQTLAPVVQGVLSLHDFRGAPMHAKLFQVRRDSTTGKLRPVEGPVVALDSKAGSDPEFTTVGGSGSFHLLAPGDWSRIYNTEPLLQRNILGAGISIAVVGSDTDIQLSDVRTFRQVFHLPARDPIFIVNGRDPGVLPSSSEEVEGDLDVEWAGAIAPEATVEFVTAATTYSTYGAFLSISDIVDNRLAQIMSVTYGECEAFLGTGGNAFLNSAYQQATAEGISVVVAAGDVGAAGCDPQVSTSPAMFGPNVSGFASTPYNAAIGGTMFAEDGRDGDYWNANNRSDFSSAIGYIPESVWNESCDPTVDPNQCGSGYYSLSAGSGGPSSCTVSTVLQDGSIVCQGAYPKPSWQSGEGVPNDGLRDLPDLALAAGGGHDGYLMCVEGSCQTTTSDGQTVLQGAFVVGGTSAATPATAGLLALVEQKTHPYQGLINFNLYKLAAADHLSACNSSQLTDPNHASGCTFYDVTSGNNNVPGQAGYSAAPGYDLATGLGSLNAENLGERWASAAKLPTATGLLASKQVVQHGQSIPVSVVVAPFSGNGVPSGEFDLMTSKLGSSFGGTLVNGRFSGGITSLPGGDYQVEARYSGDAMFAPSLSNALKVSVTPEESILNVLPIGYAAAIGGGPQPISGPINYDWAFGLQISVQGKSGVGSASGTVSIQMDGNRDLGTFPLNEGANVFAGEGGPYPFTGLEGLQSTGLSLGSHTFTVSYSGDNSFKPSQSAPVGVTVKKALPQTVAFPIQRLYTADVPINFVLAVADIGKLEVPTGTVQLYDCGLNSQCGHATPLGAPLTLHPTGQYGGLGLEAVGAEAQYRGTLSAGSHTLELAYSGDSNYDKVAPGGISAAAYQITVNPPVGMEAKIGLQQSPGTITVGQSENYVISVKPSQAHSPMPTGTVSVSDEWGDSFASVPLINGNATVVVPWFYAGPELVYVSYSGDANYTPVNSAVSAVTHINRGEPTVTLTASTGPGSSHTVLTVTVQVPFNPNIVTPAAEGGEVQLFESVNGSTRLLGSARPLTTANGGNSVLMLPIDLPPGRNVIAAKFLGTEEWMDKESNSLTFDVK